MLSLRLTTEELGDEQVRACRVHGFEASVHCELLGRRVPGRRDIEDHVN